MKKLLLLMGVLVSFLSCQKDSDKACPYLNTTEKHVNDLGVPIQTCGNEKVMELVLYGVLYWAPTTIQFGPTFDYGKLKVYTDARYLYIETIDSSKVDEYTLYVGPENLLTQNGADKKPYTYHDIKPIYKIPINQFAPGENVAIMFYKEFDGILYPNGEESPVEYIVCLYGDDAKYARNVKLKSTWVSAFYFLYTITPCCSPNE